MAFRRQDTTSRNDPCFEGGNCEWQGVSWKDYKPVEWNPTTSLTLHCFTSSPSHRHTYKVSMKFRQVFTLIVHYFLILKDGKAAQIYIYICFDVFYIWMIHILLSRYMIFIYRNAIYKYTRFKYVCFKYVFRYTHIFPFFIAENWSSKKSFTYK